MPSPSRSPTMHTLPTTLVRAVVLGLLLLGLAGFTSAADGDKPATKSKPAPVVIPGEPVSLEPGSPLSKRALVAKPTALKGVAAWTWETRRHRGNFWSMALSPDGKHL